MIATTPITSTPTLTLLGIGNRVVFSCACNLAICNTCKSSRPVSEDILPAAEFIEIDISGDTQSIFLWEHRAPTRYKWRFHALALMTAERPQFTAGQRMRRRRAIFDPADVEGAGFEVDLLPTQVDDLGRPKAMPEG
jgi:hypothetical protein